MMIKTISIRVSGKVQGVFYRQSTKEKALSLGINGEVKNMPDGSVLIVATADEKLLEQLVLWCAQGPPRATVTNIETKELQLHHFNGFSIIR